jgi:replicative DNA helicase
MKGFALMESEGKALLMEYNQRCDPPWSEHEIDHKIKSAIEQPDGDKGIGYLLNAGSDWTPPARNDYEPFVPEQSEPEPTADIESKPEPAAVRTFEDAANGYIERCRRGEMQFVETGIADLDYGLGGGVYQGEIVVIAGRPSHGKTCVALQWIHNLNAADFPTLFINLDMAEHLLGKRIIHYASPINPESWKENTEVDADIERHFEKRSRCEVVGECFHASECVTVMQESVERNQTKIVFIDYIQLLGADGKDDFHRVSAAFKIVCREARRLKVTLVALCQMNRNVESRKEYVPVMSDLKSAGQLEQDTDVILFPVYPHRHDPSNPKEEFIIHIGKNRNKETNESAVRFKFNAARQTLEMETPDEKARACDNYVDHFDDQNWK